MSAPTIAGVFQISHDFDDRPAFRYFGEGDREGLGLRMWYSQKGIYGYDEDKHENANFDAVFFGNQKDWIGDNFEPGDVIFIYGQLVIEQDGDYVNYRIENARADFVNGVFNEDREGRGQSGGGGGSRSGGRREESSGGRGRSGGGRSGGDRSGGGRSGGGRGGRRRRR